MKKKITSLILVSFVLVALSSFALPVLAQYGGTGSGTTDSSSVAAGGTVTFSGSGFEPGVSINIYLDDELIDTTTADANGNFSKEVTIPSGTSAGSHTLKAVGGDRTVTSTITVTEGGLAATGANILFGLLVASALIGLGIAMLRSSRMRKKLGNS